jgi:DNA-binding XRE family transcriptional regulator
MGKRKHPEIWNKELIEHMYNELGLFQYEIAKELGVTRSAIENVMRHLKIKTRDKSEALKFAYSQKKVKPYLLDRPKGEKSRMWKGGRFKENRDGYVFLYKPDYYKHHRDKYVLEHQYIWETFNNQKLPENYVVHHLNGIRDDNRPENLVAVPKPQHEKHTLLKLAQKRIRELEEIIKNSTISVFDEQGKDGKI